MRTADPQNIKSDFLSGLSDIEGVLANFATVALPKSNKNLIAEYSFLGASVLLEGFISDLFVAYINKKSGPFIGALTQKMTIESTDDYAKRAIPLSTVDIASHLTLEKIRKVLDPKGWNVTFAISADMKAKAGIWLDLPYKTHFTSMPNRQCALVEATKAMRNYLAHRSSASQQTMQTALHHGSLTAGFKRGTNQVHSVGSFLDSTPTGKTQARLVFYIDELKGMADQLCP
ncbi:hypothetical protein [Pseudoxanthomonas sp. JBR18]|uniref:hypothetical protein n=1 Tax=Pseudoxanthomonas sp. JBR18 TaxID=2969308 RepID=UPI0023053970|nr:hypothetical protein [Pseudoxanthomonas sp. JBR18]WCE05978.1 hypothetical protein PJ250_08525 [Pseudoxanthomonas sp. JBR18]